MPPLPTLKVLDFSRVLTGPWASMTLGDLGAEVIKIESPDGDETRAWGPPFIGDFSAYFAHVNRNKKSVVINLKTPEGQNIAHELAKQADVVIENFRTGVAERLGIGYEKLSALNPRLIYCALSGYGRTGSRKDFPGYDAVIQAQGGIMSITGSASGEPSKVGVAIVDITTGMNAVIAILAALHARHSTGVGQYIDISLFGTQVQWLSNVASNVLFSGHDAARYGNAHANIVPYGVFAAADGHFALAVGNDHQWKGFCTAINKPEWATDPRFAQNPDRVKHREILTPLLGEIFKRQTRAELLPKISAADVPCGKVHSVKEALDHPLVAEHQQRINMTTADGHVLPMVGSPLNFSATPVSYRLPPPKLGEHTVEVLKETLGFGDLKIRELLDKYVVG